MTLFQFVDSLETRFSLEASKRWMDRNYMMPVYITLLYVAAIFTGRWYMRDKVAFNLRSILVFWNTGLAIFSALGFYALTPQFVKLLIQEGLAFGVCICVKQLLAEPSTCLWGFLFTVFKMVELGDTAMVILRKTPLKFLHWYHHATVLVFSWWIYGKQPAVGYWFSVLNYGVHTIMYTYFAVKASGYQIPLWISPCITTLQMLQFFTSLGCILYAYYLKSNGFVCALDEQVFYISMGVYASYFLLFAHFFYHRYCGKQKAK